MAQYYSSIKTMKSARIGTIMPWSGDGQEGFTLANLPKGWIVCDGQLKDALDYPLLASELGKTYGGDMLGEFPNYTGQFKLPDIKNRQLVDLETNYFSGSDYLYGQTDAITVVGTSVGDGTGDDLANDFGPDAVPLTANAYADIDFSFPDPTIKLSGKLTGQTISEPNFFASITTVRRKLGINHTPSHNHTPTFPSAQAGMGGYGAQPFTAPTGTIGGADKHSAGCNVWSRDNMCTLDSTAIAAETWRDGSKLMAYYGEPNYEQTMPYMMEFQDYQNDAGKDYWSTVPAASWHDGTPTRNSPKALSQDVNEYVGGALSESFTYTPFDIDPTNTVKPLHYHPAWTGMHPRPQAVLNRRNFFGHSTGNTFNGLDDNPEDPDNWFTVTGVTINANTDEIELPDGTDIKQTKTQGTDTWYVKDKIHPWKLVDGDEIAKGTMIESIERDGADDFDDDANTKYTIHLTKDTINDTQVTDATIIFKQGTWPTSMNWLGEPNPDDKAFLSHDHGTFDLQMSTGSLKPQSTYIVSDVGLGNVSPINEDNALNIVTNIAQPAMMCVFIIKAY
ncbi:MAG: hypothetical protein CML60_10345 [Rhodobacteraceae bacterium]|nr:hypothetical protein [Paracoccaceae bacterium]